MAASLHSRQTIVNAKNLIRAIASLLAAIIVGAIGSGVWERVLSPALSYAAGRITKFLSEISQNYADSLYKSAANLYHVADPRDVSAWISALLCLGLFINALRSKRDNRLIGFMNRVNVNLFTGWVGIVYCLALLVAFLFIIARNKAVEDIQMYVQSQTEIIRPYVGEVEYRRLRSDYLRVESKPDFDKFLSELYASSETANVRIEKFQE
jgi:hypothetical protein